MTHHERLAARCKPLNQITSTFPKLIHSQCREFEIIAKRKTHHESEFKCNSRTETARHALMKCMCANVHVCMYSLVGDTAVKHV